MIGMGVADGVYQWREQGIDAGEFSRLLMQTALQAVEEGQPDVLKGLLHLQSAPPLPLSPQPPLAPPTLFSLFPSYVQPHCLVTVCSLPTSVQRSEATP